MRRTYIGTALTVTIAGLTMMVLTPLSQQLTSAASSVPRGLGEQQICVYALNPASQSFLATGGAGSLFVNTGDDCRWHAKSPDFWIVPDPSDHEESGPLNYTVAINNSFPRNGTIQILSEPDEKLVATFSVVQAGASQPSAMTLCGDAVQIGSGGDGSSTITVDQDLLFDHVTISFYYTGDLGAGQTSFSLKTPFSLAPEPLLPSCTLDQMGLCPFRGLSGQTLGTACPPDFVLDDLSSITLDHASPPYVGTFSGGFIGRGNAKGDWTLVLKGAPAGATLHCWCLRFELTRPGLTLLPVKTEVPIFATQSLRAFLTGQDGKPVIGQPVSFVVLGDKGEVRLQAVINSTDQGLADFSYSDFAPNDSLVKATATIDGVQTGSMSEVIWLPVGLSGINLAALCPMQTAMAGSATAATTLGACDCPTDSCRVLL